MSKTNKKQVNKSVHVGYKIKVKMTQRDPKTGNTVSYWHEVPVRFEHRYMADDYVKERLSGQKVHIEGVRLRFGAPVEYVGKRSMVTDDRG